MSSERITHTLWAPDMIDRIEARHYKCLRWTSVRLEPFNILIGPNASGKSTWMDVLGFLRDALLQDVETAVRKRARTLRELTWKFEEPEQGFEFAVDVAIPNHVADAAWGEKNSRRYTRLRYEVGIGRDEREGVGVRGENLWLVAEAQAEAHPARQLEIFPEDRPDVPILRPSRSRSSRGYRVVVRKTGPGGNDYYRAEHTKWNLMFRLSTQRLALSGVPEDEERFRVSLWFRRFLQRHVQVLHLNTEDMRNPAPADAPQTFQPDGSNLPIVVDRLCRTAPERFDWWLGHIQTVFADIHNIQVVERPEDRSRYLMVTYTNGVQAPSWLLSDGTLRLLALTLIAYLPQEDQIFLVEEPENGIHPRAVEAVFQGLSSVYQGQIFLATHSPLFMALAEPRDLLIFGKTATGATDIVRGHEHPELVRWRAEPRLDLLFASGVLG